MRYILFITALSCVFLFAACKKDKLHWQEVQQITTNTTDRLNEIVFTDKNTAIIAGGERFSKATTLTSHDGGKTWTVTDHAEAGKGLYGIGISPDGKVYACGFDGKLLMSEDKGDTWQFQQMSPWQLYTDVAFFTKDEGTVIGGISFYSGWQGRLNGNGQLSDWDSLGYELNRIETVDARTAYICGFGVVLKTTDAGKHWTLLNVKNDNFKNMHVSGNNIWLCGYAGSILRSYDGGNSWERLRNGNDLTKSQYHLLDIVFTDTANGWAVGENGLVIRTTDGGNNWSEYDRFTEVALRSIVQAPDGNLLVAGDNGSLYRLYIQ